MLSLALECTYHCLAIAWKLKVHNSGDFCNSIIMIILHCPKTLNSKLFVLWGCVSLCIPSLYYDEYIDINSKKIKRD